MGKKYPDKVLTICLDIETIIDHESAERLMKINGANNNTNISIGSNEQQTQSGKEEQIEAIENLRSYIEQYHFEVTDGKSNFPRQPFHRIIALSCTIMESQVSGGMFTLKKLQTAQCDEKPKTTDNLDSYERNTILQFGRYIHNCDQEYNRVNLVTFNGRSFDIPVIKYRAMVHGIPMKLLARKEYANRYYGDRHIDLLEMFSDYGSSAKVKMKEVCAVLGIPCKQDGIDGSNVKEMFDKGNIEQIRKYCQEDTFITAILYMRYMVLCGALSVVEYNQSIAQMKEQIGKEVADEAANVAKKIEYQGISTILEEMEATGKLYLQNINESCAT